jgi:DNA repair protein RadC
MRDLLEGLTAAGLNPIVVGLNAPQSATMRVAKKLAKRKNYAEFPHSVPRFRTQLVRDGNVSIEDYPALDSPAAAFKFFKTYIGDQIEEHFCAVALDSRNKVIGAWTASTGILTASIVHPREIYRPAIELSAAAIIVSHNHPSGDPTPSRDDDGVTERLAKAGDVIGIALLDHVIVGDTTYWSYRERGGIKQDFAFSK